VGNLEGKRQLGSPALSWKNNNTLGLKEIGWGGIDWTDLAQDIDHWWVLVNSGIVLRVPYNVGKFLRS
jgi:hypothetical protein